MLVRSPQHLGRARGSNLEEDQGEDPDQEADPEAACEDRTAGVAGLVVEVVDREVAWDHALDPEVKFPKFLTLLSRNYLPT